jgi:hypothetical protein
MSAAVPDHPDFPDDREAGIIRGHSFDSSRSISLVKAACQDEWQNVLLRKLSNFGFNMNVGSLLLRRVRHLRGEKARLTVKLVTARGENQTTGRIPNGR